MYNIHNKTNRNLTIFAVAIPMKETKIESLMDFFKKKAYNGKQLTEDALFTLIKKGFTGKKIILEKIAPDVDKEAEKKAAEAKAKEEAEKKAAEAKAKEEAEKNKK